MFDIRSELFWFLVKLKCLKRKLIAVLFLFNQVHGTVFFLLEAMKMVQRMIVIHVQ